MPADVESESLVARGARDAWSVPITMKKGRPAQMVQALCDAASRGACVAFLLEESSSLGVRWREIAKAANLSADQ